MPFASVENAEPGAAPLITAINDNDTMAIQKALNAGADATHRDEKGRSPLHIAAYLGHREATDLLLAAGADLWAKNTEGQYPVQLALLAAEEQNDLAERLLGGMLHTEQPSPNPDWKQKVLHSALRGGGIGVSKCIQTLIANGADIFACNDQGETALELLESWGRPFITTKEWGQDKKEAHSVAAMFLNTDPHIWPQGHINRQLWECSRDGIIDESHLILFNLLVQTGQSALDIIGPDGNTPLHYLCDDRLISRSYNDLKNRFSNTLQMITLLLDNGASISTQNRDGETPLLFAARHPWDEFIRLLLQKRPSDPAINIPTHGGNEFTPLLAAVAAGKPAHVRLLLDAGADPLATGKNGRNALHWATGAVFPSELILQWLIDAGCPADVVHPQLGAPLHIAAQYGRVAMVRMLLEAGCDPYERTAKGETALRRAASSSDGKSVEELVGFGGRELVEFDDEGSGKLVCAVLRVLDGRGHWQAKEGLKRAVKLLVEHGAVVHEGCERCTRYSHLIQ